MPKPDDGCEVTHKGLNGHTVTIIIAVLQVAATLTGGGMFIRSVEKAFDARMDKIDRKIDSHMIAAQRNNLSFNFHHTLGVTCSKGCHKEKTADFQFEGGK